VVDREGREGADVGRSRAQHLLNGRELAPELVGDRVQLLGDRARVGLGEDRPDGGGHHLGRALGHLGQHVAHEVHPADSRCQLPRTE
jgi:hypothetical protein